MVVVVPLFSRRTGSSTLSNTHDSNSFTVELLPLESVFKFQRRVLRHTGSNGQQTDT